mmetsp:Transcript_17400/g.28587  ORF Transcript_17400/g.28587 Transcript_17400/m.28587 type:complete len:547 (+) Transcript_17400:329-1969(+)
MSLIPSGGAVCGLADDTLVHIFTFVDQYTLLRGVRPVCRNFRRLVASEPSLWRTIDFVTLLQKHPSGWPRLLKFIQSLPHLNATETLLADYDVCDLLPRMPSLTTLQTNIGVITAEVAPHMPQDLRRFVLTVSKHATLLTTLSMVLPRIFDSLNVCDFSPLSELQSLRSLHVSGIIGADSGWENLLGHVGNGLTALWFEAHPEMVDFLKLACIRYLSSIASLRIDCINRCDLEGLLLPNSLTTSLTVTAVARHRWPIFPIFHNFSRLEELTLAGEEKSFHPLRRSRGEIQIIECRSLSKIKYGMPMSVTIRNCRRLTYVKFRAWRVALHSSKEWYLKNFCTFHVTNFHTLVDIEDCVNLTTIHSSRQYAVSLKNCGSITSLENVSLYYPDSTEGLPVLETLNIRLWTIGYYRLLCERYALCNLGKLSLAQLVNGAVIRAVGLEQLVIWDCKECTDIHSVTIQAEYLKHVYVYCSDPVHSEVPFSLLFKINSEGKPGFRLETFSIGWKCDGTSVDRRTSCTTGTKVFQTFNATPGQGALGMDIDWAK